tara:strand:+ start:94 stop:345 length:252 start_codon:yes stop_codon:yes gene_type:complete
MGKTFRESHQELLKAVKNALWDRVIESSIPSYAFGGNCMKIDEGNFDEIVIVDDRLQLVDENDNLSNIEVLSLDELIEILDNY